MGTFSRGLGCGTGPALVELSLELSGHSLNGGTWSVTRIMTQSSTGKFSIGQPRAEGHSSGEWRRLVCYQVFDLGSNYVAYG